MHKWSGTTAALVTLSLGALALRLGVVLALRQADAGPIAFEHGRIAENLLTGRGFSIEFLGQYGPTSQQAPFYPCLLAGAYALFGIGSPAAVLAVEVLQCLAGVGLVLATYWLASSLLPEAPAARWLAALGAAVYPVHLYMATHLQVVPWAALVLTLLLAAAVSPRWRRRWAGAVLVGGLAGLLLLIEPILALALPVAAAAFWFAEERQLAGKALGRQATIVLVAMLAIAPWTVRNWRVHGELVFVKSTFGYAFWQANNPASWGTDKIPKAEAERLRTAHDGSLAGMNRALWEARHETLYIDDVLLKPSGYREFVGLTEPQRSRLLASRAWQFIRAKPRQYARLCLRRLGYFLAFDATNPKAANRLYRATTAAWLVLAGVGLLASLAHWRRLWPTYAVFFLVTLFHTLVITSVRFRIPIEPLSFVWIAGAIAPLSVHLTRRELHVLRPGQKLLEDSNPHALKGPHWDGHRRAA